MSQGIRPSLKSRHFLLTAVVLTMTISWQAAHQAKTFICSKLLTVVFLDPYLVLELGRQTEAWYVLRYALASGSATTFIYRTGTQELDWLAQPRAERRTGVQTQPASLLQGLA